MARAQARQETENIGVEADEPAAHRGDAVDRTDPAGVRFDLVEQAHHALLVRGGDLEAQPAVPPGLLDLRGEARLVDLTQFVPGVDAGGREGRVVHHGRVLPAQWVAEEGDCSHLSLLSWFSGR
jgi:hypothetical protein